MKKLLRVLVIAPDNQYGRDILRGLYTFNRDQGAWDMRYELDRAQDVMARMHFALKQWKAHGVIASVTNSRMERQIVQSRLPAVNISGYYHANRLPTVMSDGVAVGRAVARYYLENGCRNFAFCSRTVEPSPRLRCEGFVEEIRKAGFKCNVFTDRFVGHHERDWVHNRKRMEEWLLALRKPVAMMCSHELKGREVLSACQLLDLNVPDDVAVVAVGHEDVLCRMLTPPLSTIDTNGAQIGYQAARLLTRLMRGGRKPDQTVLMPPGRLVARRSSDIVAVDDPDIATAVRYVRDHAQEAMTVKEMLREIPISRRALERRFEKAIGRTPKAEIMRVRIDRAKEMLGETDLRSAVISSRLGFTSPEKFSAAFRRKTGQTPTEFRQSRRLERE